MTIEIVSKSIEIKMNVRFSGAEDTCPGIAWFVCNDNYFGISVRLLAYFLYLFKLSAIIIDNRPQMVYKID